FSFCVAIYFLERRHALDCSGPLPDSLRSSSLPLTVIAIIVIQDLRYVKRFGKSLYNYNSEQRQIARAGPSSPPTRLHSPHLSQSYSSRPVPRGLRATCHSLHYEKRFAKGCVSFQL